MAKFYEDGLQSLNSPGASRDLYRMSRTKGLTI